MNMRPPKLLLIFTLMLLAAALLAPIQAQSSTQPAATCAVALQQAWTTASNACINKPNGYVCNGGAAPAAEPSGLVSNALAPVGALVDLSTVSAIRTAPISADGSSAGIAWLRLADPLDVTILMMGDMTMFNVAPSGFQAWSSMIVQTNPAAPGCDAAPHSVAIIQDKAEERIAINGSSLDFTGTVLVATDDNNTIFVGLEGQASILAQGQQQILYAGEAITVAHPSGNVSSASAPPSAPFPFDPTLVSNLPVPLFDRPLILPQPGFASTQGSTNLRVSPDVYSGVVTQVPGGQVLTILGSNPDQSWYHVRLTDGETGWMLANLLAANVGTISAIYTQTPLPPQRLGDLGTRAKVNAPNGANLRRGPDATFPAIGIVADGTVVDLVARSPYQNGWIKVNDNGTIGWLSLLTLETQAYIDALPIDYSAPPFPTPTRIPGTFGNAFPEPGTPGS